MSVNNELVNMLRDVVQEAIQPVSERLERMEEGLHQVNTRLDTIEKSQQDLKAEVVGLQKGQQKMQKDVSTIKLELRGVWEDIRRLDNRLTLCNGQGLFKFLSCLFGPEIPVKIRIKNCG